MAPTAGISPTRTRPVTGADSIDELTAILHRAFARFTESGIHMKAATQSVAETRKRIAKGECLIAEWNRQLIGTVVWRVPGRPNSPCGYYRRPSVATFEQLAVEPSKQGHDIGRALLDAVESRALRAGATHVAWGTAESELDLR